ncbi:hypothetical protein SAMN02745157_3088 [Kaistia soli DSM 19436]|uniref:Uncharacterized protein n=1 Tax=Kaistia soli DSM 19436 TaxID=1122133 RepID=A0A1M5FM19_9HYPH|nr:hypothetical protein [Kaistia soli]SHF92212.1 hypothetical protein SAMN02745157_3088 [Kaistia soli DSM 19436]
MPKFEWIKAALGGAVVGAVVMAVVGFSWGGWVTGSASRENAETIADARVVTALTPYCVVNAQADPQSSERLAALKSASSYQRRDLVMANGWATLAVGKDPDRAVADACQKVLAS